MRTIRVIVPVLILLASSAAQAVTYIVPADREMIQQSDDIVVATGVTSLVQRTDRGGIVTHVTLRIEEVLKGDRAVGDHLVLTERGGVIGDSIQYVPGTPEYQSGERYLVFTESNRDGEPVTFGMGLGQFFFTTDQDRRLALRADVEGFNQNLDNHVERARDAAGFLEYIRGIVAQRISPEPLYFVSNANARFEPTRGIANEASRGIATEATRGSYLMWDSGNARPFRWFTPSTTFVKSGTPVGPNGNQSVTLAFAQWNSTASNIDYDDGGQDPTAVGGLEGTDGKDAILFDDPNNEVGTGIAGLGGITSGGTPYTVDDESFWRMFEVDVVMNNGSFAQNCYDTVMVHEVGHTLGFRHSNQPRSAGDPTASSAIMNSTVSCSWNGILKDYDKDAAAAVYGSGPVCAPPSISTHPASKSVTLPSTSTTLSVVAGGTAPLTYQWFIGSSGDTSSPTGTNSNSISIAPTVTTNYWVRVTGQCAPTANSNTAIVTVLPCQAPSISTLSNDRTILKGASTQLSVTAAGTGTLHYQWYVGQPGNTAQTIGSDNRNLTVSPSSTTTYWVRVSGSCAPVADSTAVVVTVEQCPEVVLQSPTSTPSGGTTTLNINATSSATGSLSYLWFRGDTPGTGGVQVGTTRSIVVPITSTVTNYWVRVTNSCSSSTNSSVVSVASCTLPALEAQPVDQSILTGANATLALTLVGDGVGTTVTWYRGTAPDKSNLVGTGTSVAVGPLTATTSYWAAVRNTCGEIPTRTVLITVLEAPICTAPTIGVSPLTHQVPTNTPATLTVVANGTAVLQYQWYEGTKSDTVKPIDGATLATYVTPNMLKATSYWVRVTNGCGSVDSEAAVITIPAGRRRAVGHR
jgi:hypothetical protein